MSGKVELFLGPRLRANTAALLEHFSAWPDSAGKLWIAPNERIAEEIQRSLSVSPDQVTTFSGFATAIIAANDGKSRLIPDSHQRLLVAQTIHTLTAQNKLPAFRAVARKPGFLSAAFTQLKELQNLEEGDGLFESEAKTAEEIQFARLLKEYRGERDRRQLVDRESAYLRAEELWKKRRRSRFEQLGFIILDGFLDFTPSQWSFLNVLHQSSVSLAISLPQPAENDARKSTIYDLPSNTLARLSRDFSNATFQSILPRDPTESQQSRRGIEILEQKLFLDQSLMFGETQEDRTNATPRVADVRLLEAPGKVGEARMVARAVKALLNSGSRPNEIVVTTRDPANSFALMREVFAEYEIPIDADVIAPLSKDPHVRTLLQAVRLGENDFPFASTTALLRNSLIQPRQADAIKDPSIVQRSELLLRLFNEPRGQAAYRKQLVTWSESAPTPLDDERGDDRRRKEKHELAKRCRPFLEWFFGLYQDWPQTAHWAVHRDQLGKLCNNLGLTDQSESIRIFWKSVSDWSQGLVGKSVPISRDQFFSEIDALAAADQPAQATPAEAVRLLRAETARFIGCEHLFVFGLVEGSFPRLQNEGPIFREADRTRWSESNLQPRSVEQRFFDEQLLFLQLVTMPEKSLTLSYTGTDEKGRNLLPSSFLDDVRELLQPESVEKRSMLLDRYFEEEPLSFAEKRIHWARAFRKAQEIQQHHKPAKELGNGNLEKHLSDVWQMNRKRYHSDAFSAYDGGLGDEFIAARIQNTLGPDRPFSATALETYVECPFRFFMQQVLKLRPLDDPRETIELTNRGRAFHRALAKLHHPMRERRIEAPTEEVVAALDQELTDSINDQIKQVGSDAATILWQLEGERLKRQGQRYRKHWEKHVQPWQERNLALTPHLVESDFGIDGKALPPLRIEAKDVIVRIRGQVDRIDTVTLPDGSLGFWVIDYKTGSGSQHTATDLKSMRRLQLAIYALAIEEIILPGSRPLGLAYWLVAETGPKSIMPGRSTIGWIETRDDWDSYREKLNDWLIALASSIRAGDFRLAPRSENCTETCDYSRVCRISLSRSILKEGCIPLPVVDTSAEAADSTEVERE